jgi:regulator of sigma D
MLFETNRHFFLDDDPQPELEEFAAIVSNIEKTMEKIHLNLINNRLNLDFICDIFVDYINDKFFQLYYNFLKTLKRSMGYFMALDTESDSKEKV